jgi:hypothetical protein
MVWRLSWSHAERSRVAARLERCNPYSLMHVRMGPTTLMSPKVLIDATTPALDTMPTVTSMPISRREHATCHIAFPLLEMREGRRAQVL